MFNVVHIFQKLLRRPERVPTQQQIHARVRARLTGRRNRLLVTGERLAIAQAKAWRWVCAGLDAHQAVARAVAWATCATDPFPPPGCAAAA
ncbi:hypothetical protein [Tahibacter harae]|uniref:Uncharacterized protein n=1 Tax=Tahibacter harae TaxID=2963937 RepID=A0ABT1QS47_9GAMM|nr:hypothetical protein [Tahibacter harae]MCQ4165109.1 hypothetical protein [Tahibacter harae]